MTKLLFRTKGNSEPGRKPRVYFSCLPEDFEETFDATCEDIFKTQDCIIFYKEDMADELPEETWETDLGRMNLFVFPITFGMLRDEQAPVSRELAFADQERKPVLPIMFEHNASSIILELYGKRFGERQYLFKYSNDATEISYEDKLKKYLESTLISDDTAERIRKAFDAYVFLCYRKKDRKYANELMRLIHADPTCRDVAIWFDEFLTPGESFNESIDKAMRDSQMVALLVTPSLLENDAKGNKNYIQRVEYPNAKLSHKPILPAEKVYTDREALAADYEDLPEIVDANDEERFHEEFLKAISDVARREDAGDPTHDFLIGLAYLDGIDVEVNTSYGVELVTSAAEAGLPEAMEKLYQMHEDGSNIPISYQKARDWAERLYQHYLAEGGEEDPKTLTWLNNLSDVNESLGDYAKSAELAKECYEIRSRVLGEEHPDTLSSLSILARAYTKLGDYVKAAELDEKCYKIRCRVLGEEHTDTLTSLTGLSVANLKLGDYSKAVELETKAYEASRRILGEEHPITLDHLNNLAIAYNYFGDYQKEYELANACYAARQRIFGKERLDTLYSLNELANACQHLGDFQKALELDLECHDAMRKVLGEDHPDTMSILNNIAIQYHFLGDHEKALEYFKKCYEAIRGVLGDDHPDTCMFLGNLAVGYCLLGDFQKALEINQKCYVDRCKVLGVDHPLTLLSLNNLGLVHRDLGDPVKAKELLEKCYEARSRVLGKEHPDTLETLQNLEKLKKGTIEG